MRTLWMYQQILCFVSSCSCALRVWLRLALSPCLHMSGGMAFDTVAMCCRWRDNNKLFFRRRMLQNKIFSCALLPARCGAVAVSCDYQKNRMRALLPLAVWRGLLLRWQCYAIYLLFTSSRFAIYTSICLFSSV